MNHIKDITGMKFNRLTAVLLMKERSSSGCVKWLCVCDCGKERIISGSDLRKGHTKSCGCLKLEKVKLNAIKHGGCSHKNRTREYRSWQSMITRCCNPNYHSFHRYGGRGIKICDRWKNSYENFLNDIGERPTGTSLDRYPDPDGDYKPGNCRWATRLQQRHNRGEK